MKRIGNVVFFWTALALAAPPSPVDDERARLVDEIAQGKNVERNTARLGELKSAEERERKTARESANARAMERDRRRHRRETLEQWVGQNCYASPTPGPAAELPRDRSWEYLLDWGPVTRKERVRLLPKNALDAGEAVTLWEVKGQRRTYRFIGERAGFPYPDHPVRTGDVGDLMMVCGARDPDLLHQQLDGFEPRLATRLPPSWAGTLEEHGFIDRIARVPRLVDKVRMNPLHVSENTLEWGMRDVKWKYPAERNLLAHVEVRSALPSAGPSTRWQMMGDLDDPQYDWVLEVPSRTPGAQHLSPGELAWVVMNRPRFDPSLRRLTFTALDVDATFFESR